MPIKRTETPLERILMPFTYNYTWSLSSFVLAALESLYEDLKECVNDGRGDEGQCG